MRGHKIYSVLVIGELATWFGGSAVGPYLVEQGLERFRSRGEWSDHLLKDLAEDGTLTRLQRKRLRYWLKDEQIVDLLIDNNIEALQLALGILTSDWHFDEIQAAALLDGVVARFLPLLAPSAAVAVAAYQAERSLGRFRNEIIHGFAKLDAALAHMNRSPLVSRSTYHRVVAELAPEVLYGRSDELTELGRYATAPQAESQLDYVWWQGDAWTGKTALMAIFATAPPSGIDVISFFITARRPGQSDRAAFLSAVAEQAATIVGEDARAAAAMVNSDAIVLDLLIRAAEESGNRGRRLILLIDGLDEDKGLVGGVDTYSVAGFLPARLQAGIRVIVAGRPNPPIPDDVEDHHPLRNPLVIRTLARSPAAEATRLAAKKELSRLLRGNELQRAVLGIITASGGGLSAHDVQELSGYDFFDVEAMFQSVTGRTFNALPSRWRSGRSPATYILGHEELQLTAQKYLATQLAGARRSIFDWADSYLQQGWPVGTPEYLFDGYFRMLVTAGETDRLIRTALDQERHDRMLDTSGGDTLAFHEISAAIQIIANQTNPDLSSAVRLARHRNHLELRNSVIPHRLPTLWAAIGQPARAEALARSIASFDDQARALTDLAQFHAAQGDHRQTRRIVDQIADPLHQANALINVVDSFVALGKTSEASEFVIAASENAWRISDPETQAELLARVSHAFIAVGNKVDAVMVSTRALDLALTISDPGFQTRTLSVVAEALSAAGAQGEASKAAHLAERCAHTIHSDFRVDALVSVVHAFAAIASYDPMPRRLT